MKTLRLILGDQLNTKHPWFNEVNPDVTYVMAEMLQETSYVTHHIQKVIGFFLSMRNFAEEMTAKGHSFVYYRITDENNPQELESLIKQTLDQTKATQFEYQLPDEYRLDSQLKAICDTLTIPTAAADTAHFFTARTELSTFFEGKKQLIMENFYRMMRKKHAILMENGAPVGGKWNYDQNNRKKWKGSPAIPLPKLHSKDVSTLVQEIKDAKIKTIGKLEEKAFSWPTSRAESIDVLAHFCESLLVHFGDYQDAMHTEEKFLFHSRLSFAMNSKMLSPKEVIATVLRYSEREDVDIDISQIEGFVRQILGWREYMRGMYWREMPNYAKQNSLENTNPLPDFFWTGKTKMTCLQKSITQSLDTAYAHHIQRLMITGNYALLTQTHPDEVDAWYLGIYIDAIEWVEITNTRGMSQWADGGLIATKPYVSSANYINKMGNYCSSCSYSHTKKTGDDACPFNALYWNFLDEKKAHFKGNNRMAMMMNLLQKKDPEELALLKERAQDVIAYPEKY